jgi:hypothetical protein
VRLTWSLARTWSDNDSVSPAALRSTVTVRTGRTWATGGLRAAAGEGRGDQDGRYDLKLAHWDCLPQGG